MTEQENYANLVIGLLNGTLELIDVGTGTGHGHSNTIRLAMEEAQQDLSRARRGLTQALTATLMGRTAPVRTLASDRAEDR